MPPVVGAGWAANPYSHAGNNPLAMSDPVGTHPLSDTEVHAWNNTHSGTIANAWNTTANWVSDNWEYIAGAAMIVAGGALMATGLGGPVGVLLIGAASGALMSAGASAVNQKAATGTVDWGQVGTQAIAGAGAGAVGAGVGVLGAHALAAVSARIASRSAAATVGTGAETVATGTTQTAAAEVTATSGRLLGDTAANSALPLSLDRIKITGYGVAAVERHIWRFAEPSEGLGRAEAGMVARLRGIAGDNVVPEAQDIRFYAHELRESVLYRKAGFQTGQPVGDAGYDLWDVLHAQALASYGFPRNIAPDFLYHPSVLGLG